MRVLGGGGWEVDRGSARVSIRFSLSSLSRERYQVFRERIVRASICFLCAMMYLRMFVQSLF